MTFNEFVRKHILKNKATSKKTQQVLSSLSLNDVRICLRDGPFSIDNGIVNIHSSRGTHWVYYVNENYFDSDGCSPPQNLSKFIIKRKNIVFIQNTRYKVLQINEILIVQFIVYI